MRPSTLLSRIGGLLLPLALLIACGGPPRPEVVEISDLPGGRQLLLGADIGRGRELLLLSPGEPALRAWQLQDGRGLTEDGSSCLSNQDSRRWDAAARRLVIAGCFGEQGGLNLVGADGRVSNLAHSILEPGPDGGALQSTRTILRGGATELPPEISSPGHYQLAHHSDSFALSGYIWGGTVGDVQYYLYLVDPENRLTSYGEEWGFTTVEQIRWSPDDSAISFVGSSEEVGPGVNHVYRLDLASGAIERVSEAPLLIDSVVTFTSAGGLIFSAAGADSGAAPAIYYAAPGEAEAVPLVTLEAVPQVERWRGAFLLSPDEGRVAFDHWRANSTTPWTIYAVDLGGGEVRDLLPPDIAVQRTGTTDRADSPYVSLLAWEPGGQQLVFSSSFTGHCSINNIAGVVNCTEQLYTVSAEGGAPAYLSEAHLWVDFALWVE